MKLTYSELAYFCRQLAVLLHAGIGIGDGVFLLTEEDTCGHQSLLRQVGTELDGGKNLWEAMAATGAFPASLTGMIRTGEQTGHLEEALQNMALFYEQRSRSSRQIKSAVSYPAMLLALMLVVVGVLLVKVLPVFDHVYAALGSRLAGVAAGLLYAGQWLQGAMPWLFALLGLLLAAALLYGFCPPVRARLDSWCRIRFGDRGVLTAFNNASFARALAMGLGSALPLEESVELAAGLLSDIPHAAARCSRCAEMLRGGSGLAQSMRECGFLAPAESRMLEVGLRQGCGDGVMAELADRLAEQAEEQLEDKVAKLEPAMVLTASALVGMILLAVMLPLMNIMALIG